MPVQVSVAIKPKLPTANGVPLAVANGPLPVSDPSRMLIVPLTCELSEPDVTLST